MVIGVEFRLKRGLDYRSQVSIPRVGVVYRKLIAGLQIKVKLRGGVEPG